MDEEETYYLAKKAENVSKYKLPAENNRRNYFHDNGEKKDVEKVGYEASEAT